MSEINKKFLQYSSFKFFPPFVNKFPTFFVNYSLAVQLTTASARAFRYPIKINNKSVHFSTGRMVR